MASIPVVFNDYDTPIHRRDPRAKLVGFAALFSLIYVAPNWRWMAAFALLGVAMVAVARVPPKWVGGLLLVQLPNILGILALPAAQRLLAGGSAFGGNFDFGLKLAFGWSTALFVGAAVFSSMRLTEVADGLRGLGMPEFVAFTVEYIFLLFYVVLSDIYRVANALKLKGVNFETKNVVRLARGIPHIGVPAVFAVLRRSSTMMAVLKMRGYPLEGVARARSQFKFDAGDALFVVGSVAVFAATLGVRVGVLPSPV